MQELCKKASDALAEHEKIRYAVGTIAELEDTEEARELSEYLFSDEFKKKLADLEDAVNCEEFKKEQVGFIEEVDGYNKLLETKFMAFLDAPLEEYRVIYRKDLNEVHVNAAFCFQTMRNRLPESKLMQDMAALQQEANYLMNELFSGNKTEYDTELYPSADMIRAHRLIKKAEREMSDIMGKFEKECRKSGNAGTESETQKEVNALMDRVDRLRKNSVVSRKEADNWASKIHLHDFEAEDEALAREVLADCYRVAQGSVHYIWAVAAYESKEIDVNVNGKAIFMNMFNGKGLEQNLWHEIGHRFESADKKRIKKALALLESHAVGDGLKFIPGIKDNRPYSRLRTDFKDPETSRCYFIDKKKTFAEVKATEVYSTGFEMLMNEAMLFESVKNNEGIAELVIKELEAAQKKSAK